MLFHGFHSLLTLSEVRGTLTPRVQTTLPDLLVRSRPRLRHAISLAVFWAFIVLPTVVFAQEPLKLWHAYRGAEEEALEQVVSTWNDENPDARVESLAVPYDAYTSKITSAVPRGHGPDVFIPSKRMSSTVSSTPKTSSTNVSNRSKSEPAVRCT